MAIYAAFDPGGTCLYVGRSGRSHPALRWAEHIRAGKEWAQNATRWEVLPDLNERSATIRLNPRYSPLPAASSVNEDDGDPWADALGSAVNRLIAAAAKTKPVHCHPDLSDIGPIDLDALDCLELKDDA